MRDPGNSQESAKGIGELPNQVMIIASIGPRPNLKVLSKAQAGHAWQGNADACNHHWMHMYSCQSSQRTPLRLSLLCEDCVMLVIQPKARPPAETEAVPLKGIEQDLEGVC